MDLALFDFDGTITRRETMPDFLRAAVRPFRLAVGRLVFAPLVLGYRLGIVPGSAVRAALCRFAFRGIPVAELERHGALFATHFLPTVLRPQAMARIDWHRARGDRVVIVSGGLDVYLSHWTRDQGLALLCSSLEQRGDRLTGRYHGAQCVRAEKVRRVRAAYPTGAYSRVYAYGDSPEDLDLLAMADEAYYRWQPLDRDEARTGPHP